MNYRQLSLGRQRLLNSGLSTVSPTRRAPLTCNDLFLEYWLAVRGELSHDDFSVLIGIPVSTISAIERGERRLTSEHLDRLAQLQNVGIEDVMQVIASRAALTAEKRPKRRARSR